MGDGTKSPRGKGLTIQVHHGDTKTHLHTEFENYTFKLFLHLPGASDVIEYMHVEWEQPLWGWYMAILEKAARTFVHEVMIYHFIERAVTFCLFP